MSIFCKHKWLVISEHTTKSKFEVATSCMRGQGGTLQVPWQMSCAERKFIQVLSCDRCGKLKKFVEIT